MSKRATLLSTFAAGLAAGIGIPSFGPLLAASKPFGKKQTTEQDEGRKQLAEDKRLRKNTKRLAQRNKG